MSEQGAGRTMDDGAERLRRELHETVDRIRRSGGGVVFEEFPGALQETPLPGAADAAAASRARTTRDSAVAAQHALLAAADGLAETLRQLDAAVARARAPSSGSAAS